VIERSVITCPSCGHQTTELMPTDACQYFYDCQGCGTLLKPKEGDCDLDLDLGRASGDTADDELHVGQRTVMTAQSARLTTLCDTLPSNIPSA